MISSHNNGGGSCRFQHDTWSTFHGNALLKKLIGEHDDFMNKAEITL